MPNFDALLVHMQAPQSLPDPNGLNAALSAIVTADLFRNMSGEAATGAAGQASAAAATETSIAALANAGSAFAKTLKTLTTGFGALTSKDGLKTLSSVGAMFNEMQKTAKANGAAGAFLGSEQGRAKTVMDLIEDAIKGTLLGTIKGAPGGPTMTMTTTEPFLLGRHFHPCLRLSVSGRRAWIILPWDC